MRAPYTTINPSWHFEILPLRYTYCSGYAPSLRRRLLRDKSVSALVSEFSGLRTGVAERDDVPTGAINIHP